MLEDFFTLTEMKDGISTVPRIAELICEIHNLKNAVELNTADKIRQCSTAANTLASTKNQDCLDQFVRINGISFLHQWLQDAQNCSNDVGNAAQDLIVALLNALDRLPIDNTQAVSLALLPTVQHLLAHGNAKINQMARLLFQKWSSVPNCSTDGQGQDVDSKEACQTGQLKVPEASQETGNNKHDGVIGPEITEDKSEADAMICSDIPLRNPPHTDDQTDILKQPLVLTSPNSSNGDAILEYMSSSVSSLLSHGALGNMSATKEASGTNDLGLGTNCMLQSDTVNAKNGAGEFGAPHVIKEAKSPEPNKMENLFVGNKLDVEDQNISASFSVTKGRSFSEGMPRTEKNTMETSYRLSYVSPGLQDSSDEESMGKEEGPTSSSDMDGDGTGNGFRLKKCMKSFGDSSKAAETKLPALKGDKSMPLAEYDDTDALEVARLVAIEVEREVIDYRGPFCGSPDSNSRRSDSPDLEECRHPEPPVDELNDNKSSTTGDDSESSSSLKEDGSGITDDSGPFSRKHKQQTELGYLDLNENQCIEEIDCHAKSIHSNSINLSMPIAVAASRASSVFPARLRFEGELGWKGSAATSAFRPASPRRTPEGEKPMLASSQKTSSNMFDLNVAESENATADELFSTTILPTSSVLASKDISSAVCVSGGLNLDLNCPCGDEETADTKSNLLSFWNRQQPHGDWRHPSSSSSSRQPAIRNFDLNDMSLVDSFSRGIDEPYVKTSGRDASDISAVTILGKRIVLGQQEHSHQNQNTFLGPSVNSRVPARPTQSYAHTQPDYNVVSYPSQPSLSFPPPFYAPGGVPYMVDAKGAPVIPQLSGLGVGISHPSFSSRAIPPASAELGYFHPGVDLNYGLSSEGSRREVGSYWPMPFQGQTIFVDERARNTSQGGSNSRVLLKRNEPDSGWDLYSRR